MIAVKRTLSVICSGLQAIGATTGAGKTKTTFRQTIGFWLCLVVVCFLAINLFIYTIGEKKSSNSNGLIPPLLWPRPANMIFLDDDTQVDTSGYTHEYSQLKLKQRNMLQKMRRKNQTDQDKDKVILKGERPAQHLYKPMYTILEYTTVFYEPKWCTASSSQQHLLFLEECPHTNCQFTCDRSQFRSADAVMFHEWDLERTSVEDMVHIKTSLARWEDRSNQIWLLFNDEPFPISSGIDYLQFNWTMSYRFDSEVNDCAYGCSYNNHEKKPRWNENEEKDDKREETRRSIMHQNMFFEFEKRASRALWFVSNCAATARLKFANELNAAGFPVRIKGNCELKEKILDIKFLDLFKGKEAIAEEKCLRSSRCEYDEFKSSKFYLAFESQNCTSYITEKLWRTLRTRAIPVVFQPSKEHYELVAPPNSFIHVEDFEHNATMLANYLNFVSKNFEEYMKYHAWRMDMQVVYSMPNTESRRLCDMCSRLNTERDRIFYKKVSSWFNNQCKSSS